MIKTEEEEEEKFKRIANAHTVRRNQNGIQGRGDLNHLNFEVMVIRETWRKK